MIRFGKNVFLPGGVSKLGKCPFAPEYRFRPNPSHGTTNTSNAVATITINNGINMVLIWWYQHGAVNAATINNSRRCATLF